jgi:spore maturation protein CgeB
MVSSNRRVLIIGPFSPGQLAESFACAFAQLEYEVFRFDSDRAYFQAGRGAGNRALRRLLRRAFWNRVNRTTIEIIGCVRPAWVLVVKGAYLHPETIRHVRRTLGVPFANYYADNPYCGVPWNPRKPSAQRRDLIDALREYTRVWIWERGLARRLAADGAAADYLPFGVDPQVFEPREPAVCFECKCVHPVVFVGQHYDKRGAHLGAIRRHAVGIWGSRWRSERNGHHVIHRRAAFAAECARLYSTAAVSLNVLADENTPGHNMRTFEIPGSGGLMLSTYTAEQAEFFPEDEAALYYRDPDEIDDKIDRVLQDPVWAETLRRHALAIATQHHYTERARAIVADLGV